MKKSLINRVNLVGYVYQHTLENKVSGPTSKNPGTPFISGNLDIATDDALTNIVTVHFTYVTPTTSKGESATYKILNDIINGTNGCVMDVGAENAARVRIDSAIALNEFYTDRNGKDELVSTKRCEGGFLHLMGKNEVSDDGRKPNEFDVDMVITGTRIIEADEEKGLPEKMILKGAIFDFRGALMPVEFSVFNQHAMSYFEGLDASSGHPVFTRVRGELVSEVITREVREEGAWGDPIIRKYSSTRKDYVVTWAASDVYLWDDETTMTADELKKAMADRELYLAGVKKRQEDYKASKNAVKSASIKTGGFDF